MLDSLITSKTRVKLLLKFFINPETRAYLRGLAEELGESTNAVRVELNRMAQAGLLEASADGRTKLYKANTQHTLFPELHSLVKKYLGIDQLIDLILSKLGNVDLALITGDYAKGIDSGIIDLTIVGSVDRSYLQILVDRTEELIHRKVRVLVLNIDEFEKLKNNLDVKKALLVWANNSTDKVEGKEV